MLSSSRVLPSVLKHSSRCKCAYVYPLVLLRINLHNKQQPTLSRCHRGLVTQVSPTISLMRSEQKDNEIYLIGTAHVSENSAQEVTDLIDTVQPEKVFVELDPPRAARLIHENRDMMEQQFQQAANQITQNLPAQILGSREQMLGEYIKGFYKVLKRYGLLPGVDMLAGIRAGQRVGSTLVYGDRDANDTLRELTATLKNPAMLLQAMTTPVPPEIETAFQQAMSGLENIGETVETIKTRDYANQMSDWITRAFPDTAEVLIHRRDVHMAQQLHARCGQGKVVAVVGMAHMDGIEREWMRIDS